MKESEGLMRVRSTIAEELERIGEVLEIREGGQKERGVQGRKNWRVRVKRASREVRRRRERVVRRSGGTGQGRIRWRIGG